MRNVDSIEIEIEDSFAREEDAEASETSKEEIRLNSSRNRKEGGEHESKPTLIFTDTMLHQADFTDSCNFEDSEVLSI